jgi:hypothetical protein
MLGFESIGALLGAAIARDAELSEKEISLKQKEIDLFKREIGLNAAEAARHREINDAAARSMEAHNDSREASKNPLPIQSAEDLYQAATGSQRQPFNKLSPAEVERLACIAEECGEIQQIIGKILRHGYESRSPDGGPDNRKLLEMELGDLVANCHTAEVNGDIDGIAVRLFAQNKLRRIGKYLHHNTIVKK